MKIQSRSCAVVISVFGDGQNDASMPLEKYIRRGGRQPNTIIPQFLWMRGTMHSPAYRELINGAARRRILPPQIPNRVCLRGGKPGNNGYDRIQCWPPRCHSLIDGAKDTYMHAKVEVQRGGWALEGIYTKSKS